MKERKALQLILNILLHKFNWVGYKIWSHSFENILYTYFVYSNGIRNLETLVGFLIMQLST